ncbi:uncharacterized protein LOC124789618 [Schistocerca piceifrons]|uniref:uncharacterized protein LOC124789618 n=1 Tax=Schistocerca piceifrons TaxID=274613 RepID=UPI001F5E5640|nr:uncharacterized protein LOC124789618 [Schistocerca piceifrons]
MTFYSHTSEDVKSPVTSDASLADFESPQLVTKSVNGLGESYVVIAGSKPLSIIIKKCILQKSISDFNNFTSNSEQCSDNGNNQLSVEEDRYSRHCLEIACVSSEEATAPCFKSSELHLDSISKSINECDAIADGSAICEIDCGLVNGSQNSDIPSDATCSQQENNYIPLCDVNELNGKRNTIMQLESSSACSAAENSIANAGELEEETNVETLCTPGSEVYVRSEDTNVITETDSKMSATQIHSKESGLYGTVDAILLDENAVSSLSPTFAFYGTVEGMSDVIISQDNINDSDVLNDTHISSAGSPASPVLGSASKVQKGTRTRRGENSCHLKVKCVERLHNVASCDTPLCSYQRTVSHCCSREGGGVGEHETDGEAAHQSLPSDRRNFLEIGVLSLEKQKMLNILEDSCPETTEECNKSGRIDENSPLTIQEGVNDGSVIGENVRKNDEAIYHQNIINFSAGYKNLNSFKSCSDTSLILKNCFHNSTRLHEDEKFGASDICSSAVPGANSILGGNLHQEEKTLLSNAGEIETTSSSVSFNTSIHSEGRSVHANNVYNITPDTDRAVANSDIKLLAGDCVHETQEISSSEILENGCLEEKYDENQTSQVKEKCNDFKVPMEERCQLDCHSQSDRFSQNLLLGMCPASDTVPEEDNREASEKCNKPYIRDNEDSCTRSDSVFEDFCFDSVKEFDNDYFDQLLDSPVIDTSKVGDRARYLSVCDSSSPDPKGDPVRNDLQMYVDDSVSCSDNTLQEPNFIPPEDSLNCSVTIERTFNSANQLENSPLLFASDDESSGSQWEGTKVALKENKSPSRTVTPVTMHSTIIEALHSKLQKIQELLLGIPPPPSITMPNHTVEEMLRLIKQNEHLMVQKSFTNSGNMPESCDPKRTNGALRDVLNTSWPQVKDCAFFDIQYNHGAVSEELDRQYQRLQERFVGRETASSCNPWFTTWNASKSSVRYQRSLGQSPGSRLSHLARRRQSFSSCNLQPASISGKLPGVMHRSAIERRVIMVDAKKEEKQQKHKINNRRLQRSTICIGEDDSKLRSSRRALFQSPVDDKKVSSYLKSRTESNNTKTDVWGGTTKLAENRSRSLNENFNINGKRVMSDSQSHPRKISRRLVFDASQPVGHSLSHNAEFNRHSSVSRQLTEKKSNSSYVNGNHRSQVLTQPLSSSQAASKSRISGTYKKKLLWAVAEALRRKGITMTHHLFHPCASSLTRLLLKVVGNTLLVQSREDTCKTTSEQLLKTALQHVHTVVQKTEAGCS